MQAQQYQFDMSSAPAVRQRSRKIKGIDQISPSFPHRPHHAARAHVTCRQPALAQPRRWAPVPAVLGQLAARPAAAACVVSLGSSPGEALGSSHWKVPTHQLLALPSLEGLEGGPDFLLKGPLEPLWQLTRLQLLQLNCWALSGNWGGMAHLPRLRRLELAERVHSVPALYELPALACRLTALTVHGSYGDVDAGWVPLARLTSLVSLAVLFPSVLWPDDLAAQLPALAPSLEALALYSSGLDQAPPQLAACSKLTRLELGKERALISGTSLSVLGALTRLQHLAVSETTAGPDVLSELSALTHLSLNAHFGREFSRLQPLTLLRELNMSVVCLRQREAAELAAALAAASRVTSLGLSDSMFFSWAPAWRSVLQMTQLRALALNNCDHGPLPAGISALPALTSLSLGRRSYAPQQEATVVDSLQHLLPLAGTLAHLSLANWKLTAIPPTLAALTALSHIDLSGNDISGGWGELRTLPRLCKVEPRLEFQADKLGPLKVLLATLASGIAASLLLRADVPWWCLYAFLLIEYVLFFMYFRSQL